jgi:hypothetical protein
VVIGDSCLLDVAVRRARGFGRSGSGGSDITGITYHSSSTRGVLDWFADVDVGGGRHKLVWFPPDLVGVYSVVREILKLIRPVGLQVPATRLRLSIPRDYSGYVLDLPIWLQAALKRIADMVVSTDLTVPGAYDRPPVEPLLTACNPRAVEVSRSVKAPKVQLSIIYRCKSYIGDLKLKVTLEDVYHGYINFNFELYRESGCCIL